MAITMTLGLSTLISSACRVNGKAMIDFNHDHDCDQATDYDQKPWPLICYLDIGPVHTDQLCGVSPLLGPSLKVGKETESEVHLRIIAAPNFNLDLERENTQEIRINQILKGICNITIGQNDIVQPIIVFQFKKIVFI